MLPTVIARVHQPSLVPQHRRFDVLWAGQAVSQFGDYLAFFSVPLLVTYLINAPGESNSSELGIWYALDSIPAIVLGLLGGVLIDRVRLRGLMIVSDGGRALMFALLAWATRVTPEAGSRDGLMLVFFAAFVLGSLSTTFNNALYTLVPALVPDRKLANANGRLSASQNMAFALGPAIAGLLVAAYGFWITFAINAATFGFSMASLLLIGTVPRPEPEGERAPLSEDLVNGLRFVWREPRLRITTIAAAAANLVIGFVDATLVLIATRVAGATEGQVGLVYSSLGVGAVLGSLLAPTVIRWLGLGRSLVIGMITFGSGILVFTNIPYGYLALGQVAVAWVGLQLLNIPLMTIRQSYTPSVMLGRVLSATRAVGWASLPVGALLGTAVADRFDMFEQIAATSPVLMILVGVSMIPTVVWRNTRQAPR